MIISYNYNIKIKLLDIIARSLNSTLKNTNKFLIKKIVQKSSKKLVDRKREKSFGGRRIRNEKLRFQR